MILHRVTRPDAPKSAPLRRADFVLVGGVPGAGKSTAIATAIDTAAPGLADMVVLDPDALRAWFAQHLPAGTPYGWYRPLVHVIHFLQQLWVMLAGPAGGRRVVIHDPSTRSRRLRLIRVMAEWRGWAPLLVFVDTPPHLARQGQYARGRVVQGTCFEGHCERWLALRADAATGRCHGWRTLLCTRADAADTLRSILDDAG